MLLKFTKSVITDISCSVPSISMDLLEYSKEIGINEDEAIKIIKTTGIKKINLTSKKQTSSDLCIAAFKNIVKYNSKNADGIDAIIFVSQTPDYIAPQTSNILQHKLGFDSDILTFDFRIGCSGYVYGLLQANLLINAGLNKVLLLSGDTSTKFINKKDKSVSMVFGDAGSATIIKKNINEESFFEAGSDGSKHQSLIIKDGGFRNEINPNSFNEIKISDGIIRSDIDLFMDGMSIMNFAIERVPNSVERLLKYSKIRKEDVNKLILHQANEFMLKYLAKKMSFKNSKVPFESTYYGNTGPASIPIALCNLFSKNNIDKTYLRNILLSGFGIGLSWASCILNLDKTRFHKTTRN